MWRNTCLATAILSVATGMTSVAHAADCSCVSGANRLNENQINQKLAGKVVCAELGNERWQELHSGSRIVELGNNSKGDDIGSWSVVGNGNNAKVSYNYTGGSSSSYEVCEQGSYVHFCGARNITNATLNSAKCW